MALSKTQINYLEDKLNRVVGEKIDNFKQSLNGSNEKDLVFKGLQDGSIKMISEKEIIDCFKTRMDSYYSPSINLTELISDKDYEKIRKIVNENQDKINNYSNKLRDAKQNALDKIVLEGVDVETALAELNKIK